MIHGFKYRFYPTEDQELLLRKTVGCCRYVHNRALELKSKAWTDSKKSMSFSEVSGLLTQWKKDPETEWLGEVSSVALQQSLRNLDVAYSNFFKKRSKYPRFKSKKSGGSVRFVSTGFRIKDGNVWIAKTADPLNVVWSRPLPEGVSPTSCTVSLTPDNRWFISFVCEDPSIRHLPKVDSEVGLDMGLTSLVTLSTGEKITNHRHARTDHVRLKKAQQRLAKKQKGSANRRKARIKVARIYARIADRRRDQLHKLTTRLVHENQVIAVEDLNVRGMQQNRKLARSISDASWTMMKQFLEYKCDWYGRELVVNDRWYPSTKTCFDCGHVVEKLPLEIREWVCPVCKVKHDRDVNAARNILAVGHTVLACGETVRPKRGKALRLDSMKQESVVETP